MDIESLGVTEFNEIIIPEALVTAEDLKKHKKQISCSLIARVLLKNFDRSQLVFTKSGNLHMRAKTNRLYMNLVDLSECDELGNINTKKELFSLFPKSKDGSLDMEYQVNKDYLQEVINYFV